MRNLKYLLAAAALGSLMALPQTSSASPLVGGLASGNAALPELSEGLVQKVHSWHCSKKKGWYRGKRYWHRHSKACHRRYHRPHYYYDDDDYYDYSYYRYHRPYRYHAYPYFPGPFIGFSFGGGHRGWGWDD